MAAAVFVSGTGELDPCAFLRCLHSQAQTPELAIFVCLRTEGVPHVPVGERAALIASIAGVSCVQLRFGFNDEPDVPQALSASAALRFDEPASHYFVVPEPFARIAQAPMAAWRKRLFLWMAAASAPVADYLRLPAGRTTTLH